MALELVTEVFRYYCKLHKLYKNPDVTNLRISRNIDSNSLINRNDHIFFVKLSKMSDYKAIMLSNFLIDNTYIGNIISERGAKEYLNWKKRTQSLTYVFERDIKNLLEDFNANFLIETKSKKLPYIINLYMNDEITLETLVIFTNLYSLISYWDKKVVDKFIFPDIIKKIKFYNHFLKYDSSKFYNIIKETYGEYNS